MQMVCISQAQSGKFVENVEKLEIVHADVFGPINPVAVDEHKYSIGVIDSYTRIVKVKTILR